jgi:hypothetical protein
MRLLIARNGSVLLHNVSCNTISIDEFASTTPVGPPIVNRNTNRSAHRQAALYVIRVRYIVTSHLKILITVGTAIYGEYCVPVGANLGLVKLS